MSSEMIEESRRRRDYDSTQANYDSAVTQIFVAPCC